MCAAPDDRIDGRPPSAGSNALGHLGEDESLQIWLRGRTWMAIVAAALLLTLLDAGQTSLIRAALGQPPFFIRTLLRYGTFWLTFVAWIPPVLYLANRYRLEVPVSLRRIFIHALGGSAFAVVHIATAVFLDPTRSNAPGIFSEAFLQWVRLYSGLDFLAYWAVVGGFYTVHYHRQLRERELTAARLQVSLTEARLQALRTQLDPHFLFNTLNTISVLVGKGERQRVRRVLAQLSDLLRISLDEARPQEIRLASELEFLDGYLEIQRTRFADRLSVRWNVQPDTLDALVPSLILQPLVENAVVHGVARQRGCGVVTVEAARENGTLLLRVGDTGRGFGSADPKWPARGGIGLANTRERLQQLYGAQHRIEFGDSPDAGGMVTIALPFRIVPAAREM